jgi:two-component system cell cycle sensor histidine kinase/response regulator CckA
VLWPVVTETVAERKPAQGQKTGGKALVVDDEIFVRELTASTLEELGYEPLLAGDAVAALDLFRKHRDAVGLAVLDVVMPGMSGDELLDQLRVFAPDLPVVVVSGFADRRALRPGARTEFLQKPFHPEELIAVVKRVATG